MFMTWGSTIHIFDLGGDNSLPSLAEAFALSLFVSFVGLILFPNLRWVHQFGRQGRTKKGAVIIVVSTSFTSLALSAGRYAISSGLVYSGTFSLL